MNNSLIVEDVLAIVNRKICDPNIRLSIDDCNKMVLSDEWGLEARDLLMIMIDIERHYNICFNEKTLNEIGFRSIAEIVQAIC